MKVMSLSDARQNLSGAFDTIERDAEELMITRSGHQPMVVLPLEDYQAMLETLYLMRGANGRRLRRSIEQLEANRTRTTTVDELSE
jgi:antitoxin YefM